MTTNYPSAEEIMSLAADIVENGNGHYYDYVENVLIPAAKDTFATEGDAYIVPDVFISLFGHGYHLTTVINCARQIASELETRGYVIP